MAAEGCKLVTRFAMPRVTSKVSKNENQFDRVASNVSIVHCKNGLFNEKTFLVILNWCTNLVGPGL